MQLAQARGARVWSTPWTPAAGFKSTNDIYDTNVATGSGINGGSYLGAEQYHQSELRQPDRQLCGQHEEHLRRQYLRDLDSKRAGRECDQLTKRANGPAPRFTILSPTFTARWQPKDVGSTKIMLPESENWSDPHICGGQHGRSQCGGRRGNYRQS